MMRLEADKVDVSFYRDQSLQRNIPLTAGIGSTEVDRNSIENLDMAKQQLGAAANDFVKAIKEVCEKIDLPSNNFVNEPWPSHLYFEDLNGESEFSLVELILKQVYECPKIVR
jgi:acetylornithine/succinyldiaminopimelate/putrescine aminotransferase